MEISRRDAGSLIAKWFDERTALTALFVTSGAVFTVKVSGFINGFSSRIILSDGTPDKTSKPKNLIIFPADSVAVFEYKESREAVLPDESHALVSDALEFTSVSFVYENGDRLTLFTSQSV